MNSHMDARRVVERYLHDVLGGPGATPPDEVISNETLRQKVAAFRRSFGNVEVTPHLIVAAGDHAAVHFSARAIHTGTFQGIRPTGRSWTASCSALFRVEDGRIADFWVTWDVLAILEQIGGLRRLPGSSA